MWWWQSVAFGGALVFAGAVPVDHGTCCACADDIAALAADAPIIAKTVLRFQSCPGIVASPVVAVFNVYDRPQCCSHPSECARCGAAPTAPARRRALTSGGTQRSSLALNLLAPALGAAPRPFVAPRHDIGLHLLDGATHRHRASRRREVSAFDRGFHPAQQVEIMLVAIGFGIEIGRHIRQALVAGALDVFLHEPVIGPPRYAGGAHRRLLGASRDLVGMQVMQAVALRTSFGTEGLAGPNPATPTNT